MTDQFLSTAATYAGLSERTIAVIAVVFCVIIVVSCINWIRGGK